MLQSPNFEFLRSYDDMLVVYAARAERYVFDDPNTSLIKTRQFGELLARHAAARNGLDPTGIEFRDLINLLRRQHIATRESAAWFELVRLYGNEAAHDGRGDQQGSLVALMHAHELAYWFVSWASEEVVEKYPFRPPPNPRDLEASLKEEIEQIRAEADAYSQELMKREGRQQELAQKISELERESNALYVALTQRGDELEAADRLRAAEQRVFEERLRALAAQSVPHPVLQSLIERSREAARRLYLRGDDAEHLPLTMLRIQSESICCGSRMVLVQSMKGGFVTKNCTICNRSRSVSGDEFLSLDLRIDCPNCKTRTDVSQGRNYGFFCQTCGWECWLASLLPDFRDV